MRSVRGVPRSVTVGVLATVSMDAVLIAAGRIGGEDYESDKVGLELVGRSAAGLAHGRCLHDDIAAEPPVGGEAAIGLAVHYLTGITLTKVYYDLLRLSGRGSSVPAATAYGVATALLPLLVMYPAWGLGPFAARSGEARRLVRLMLIGHTSFGAAIGCWTRALS